MLAPLLDSVSDGGRLQPRKMANVLGVTLDEVATLSGTHRNTLARASGRPRVQERLGPIVKIRLCAVEMMAESGSADARGQAILWFRFQPLHSLGGATAAELVRSGQAPAVMAHLRAMQDGGYA